MNKLLLTFLRYQEFTLVTPVTSIDNNPSQYALSKPRSTTKVIVPLFDGFGNTDKLANSNSLVAKAQAEAKNIINTMSLETL